MKHVVAAKVKQGRKKQIKDVIFAKAKQRRAKHVKYEIFAHTKQSLEKLVKHEPFPAQKKGNDMFFIENHGKIRWFPRRRAEARKARKIRVFRIPKDTFWKAVASVIMEKPTFLLFLHNKKPVFNAVLKAKSVPHMIFGTPKACILRAFRTFPCLPRRIAKSTVFYGEITAFVGRKTRFFLFSPSKLD